MSLGDFIARLDAAHLDVDAAQVLDALWLANLGRDLSLHETPALSPSPSAPIPAEAPDGDRQGRNTEKPKNTDVTPPPALQRLKRPRNVDVFPAIEAPQSRGTLPASPVALPAPRALANRLALMRALRPLSQRWRSHQYAEVDEELTAESCFRVGTNKARLMLPAFKPRRERWFDVELVVEDEPSAQLWDPMLREFAGLLRETGAFGSVRQWRLCVDSKEAAAHLENGLGIRVATGSLLGKAARRLVIVATTGASSRWADGSIAKVVSPWTHDNSVVLLQLTAPERWARSSLGEPQAFAWTTTPGAAAAALKVQTHWWKITRDWNVSVVLPLPVITLTPAALGQWASMQMARGRANPAYLLNNANPDSVSIDRTAAQLDFSRVVALLKYESSEIFQLAVFLSTGVFTLTVAQLVQAIKFGGNADPGMLAELLRCGLVIPVAPNSGAGGTAFSVHPQARELLQRSLRDSEAVRLAHDVQVQISLQISNFVGSGVRSSQLIADEDGQHHLPEWARPFASLATSLLGLPENSSAAQRQLSDFFDDMDPASMQAIARLAASSKPLKPSAFVPAIWERLLKARLVFRRNDAIWAFAPHVRHLFAEKQITTGQDADWLYAGISVLQSMALSFHMGQVLGTKGKRERIPDVLSSWTGDLAAALAHWMYMSEYVFWGPVRTVLITGEDPFLSPDSHADRATFDELLDKWRNRNQGSSRQLDSAYQALHEIRNAVRLLAEHEPELFEELTLFDMEEPVRAFMAESRETSKRDETWWAKQRIIQEWLSADNVATAVARYCSEFFRRFASDGFSNAARAKSFVAYIACLLDVWKNASQQLFAKRSRHEIAIDYAVNTESLMLVMQHLPDVRIHLNSDRPVLSAPNKLERANNWRVSSKDYVLLIERLGNVVLQALSEKQTARRPKVLWVSSDPKVGTHEREYALAEGKLTYTLATTKAEALAYARASLFDVVIAESEMNSSLLSDLRRDGNHIPFVMYSPNAVQIENSEARRRGAVGQAVTPDDLSGLLLKAIMAKQAVLDRPVNAESLHQYAAWRYPGLLQRPELADSLARDLDTLKYPTLLEIDQAVTLAWDAVAAYVADSTSMADSANRRLIVAICLVDPVVRTRFGSELGGPFEKFLSLVHGNETATVTEEEDASLSADDLTKKLHEQIAADAIPTLRAQIEEELGATVATADWIVEGNSYLSFETNGEYAELIDWDFASSPFFQAIDYNGDTLVTSGVVTAVIEVHCAFGFSVKDGIDKDMVPIGHLNASRTINLRIEAGLIFSGVASGQPILDSVSFEHIAEQVDFGNVEPSFESDDDDERS